MTLAVIVTVALAISSLPLSLTRALVSGVRYVSYSVSSGRNARQRLTC